MSGSGYPMGKRKRIPSLKDIRLKARSNLPYNMNTEEEAGGFPLRHPNSLISLSNTLYEVGRPTGKIGTWVYGLEGMPVSPGRRRMIGWERASADTRCADSLLRVLFGRPQRAPACLQSRAHALVAV